VLFLKTHYKHIECVAVTVKKLHTILRLNETLTVTTGMELIKKFKNQQDEIKHYCCERLSM